MVELEKAKLSTKDKDPALTKIGVDLAVAGLGALRSVTSLPTELASDLLEKGKAKLIEAALPYLLICVQPVKPADPDAFQKQAEDKFDAGEAMRLVRRKIFDFRNFKSADEAKLKAFWIFPKANERPATNAEHKTGFELAYRKFLEPADLAGLSLKALSPVEEVQLAVLSRKVLLERQAELAKKMPKQELDKDEKEELARARAFLFNRGAWADALKPEDHKELRAQANAAVAQEMADVFASRKAILDHSRELAKQEPPKALERAELDELSRCNRLITNREVWAPAVDGNLELRRKLNETYFEIITARAEQLGLDKTKKDEWKKIIDFLRDQFDKTGAVKPENKYAVLSKDGPVTDQKTAETLLSQGKALSREELLYYTLFGRSKIAEATHDEQERLKTELVTNLTNNPRAGEGGSADPTLLADRKDTNPDGSPIKSSWWTFVKEIAGTTGWYGLLGYGITEAVASVIAAKGGRLPLPITRGLFKGVFWNAPKAVIDAIRNRNAKPDAPAPSTGPDDASTRLRDDRMARRATGESFKSEGTAVFKALDPSKKAGEAGTKLGKFLTDFAMNEELDARIAEDKLKIEVKFVDAVTATNGMEKGECTSSSRDGVTTLTLTFPKDATPAEIAHDSYNFLFELERSGKGSEKALNRADRAAIGRAFTSLGVDFSTPSDARSSADALPDSRRAATPDPVVIVITEAGVSIGSEKFAIDKVNKAIRDQLEENVKKLDKEGKKAGDADYDDAKKSFDEHDALAKALEGPDGTAKTDAQTKATEKIKTAFEDGNLAKKLNEDIGRTMPDEKGRSRAVVLAMFAARFAAPTAAVLAGIGILGTTSKLRAEEAKRAPIIPIVLPKKQDK